MAPPSCTSMRMRRPAALVACLALAGCGFAGGSERPETTATLLLDAPPSGIHAGIFSAIRRGYDEAEGVHPRVRSPARPPDGAPELRRGRAAFAFMAPPQPARERERGRDVVGLL